MTKEENKLEKLSKFAAYKGFVYPGSEIYGGLANTWDYGPLGVELKNNIKREWWLNFVTKRKDMVGLDAAILMNPQTWVASGHVGGFSDPLMDCKECKNRVRADKIIEEFSEERPNNWAAEKTPAQDVLDFVNNKQIPCPKCGKCNWTEPKQFNLMFKTHQGVTEEAGREIYLRPETAQGIFVNFKNVQRTSRKKLPFGIAQIGKSFRNEITPGNFTFRTREFEQMEIEYFFNPKKTEWTELFADFKNEATNFFENILGVKKENLRFRDHDQDELSHYSRGTTDVEYAFPFGWGELAAAGAYRTDFDLTQHQKFSGQNMEYLDEESGEKLIPHVIEPSYGADRVTLAVMLDAYTEEVLEDEKTRELMKLSYNIAPYKIAILPLIKKPELKNIAENIYNTLLSKSVSVDYDESGTVGKRYRRQDENGTPWCLVVDFESIEDDSVTLRHRDTMKQIRVKITDIENYLNKASFLEQSK